MMKWDEVIDSRGTVLSFQYFQLSSSPFSFQHSSTSFSLQFPWERRPRPRFLCSLTQRLYTSSLRYVSRCKRTPTLSTANNDDDLFFFLSDVSDSLSNSFFLSLPPFSPPFSAPPRFWDIWGGYFARTSALNNEIFQLWQIAWLADELMIRSLKEVRCVFFCASIEQLRNFFGILLRCCVIFWQFEVILRLEAWSRSFVMLSRFWNQYCCE